MSDWGERLSRSSFRTERCPRCKKKYDAWETNIHCYECQKELDLEDRSDWLLLNSENPGHFKGHFITTVDGKDYYHEEWAKNKVYEKYQDYEREERAPAMKQAAENFKKLEKFKKETNESL